LQVLKKTLQKTLQKCPTHKKNTALFSEISARIHTSC
jgi:hypothetical protein